MGLPVPKMLMEDLTKTRYPFHYQILDKIAGRDLGLELHNMTKDQMTRLAKTIVSYQQQVAKLPLGSGYGWVPIGNKGEFRSWTDLIQRDFQIGLPNVKKHLSPTQTDCIVQELDRIIPYLASIQPVCFLDDVTTKNVLVLNGELQGIVDLDCVCYGDPLYMIALTQTAICADMHVPDLYYIDALCRAWGLTNNQRKIVDFYSLIFAMTFLGFFGEDFSGHQRMLTHIERWIAVLSH
jgi:aminoglycoside phosphotransferase (APT) family kinase protein